MEISSDRQGSIQEGLLAKIKEVAHGCERDTPACILVRALDFFVDSISTKQPLSREEWKFLDKIFAVTAKVVLRAKELTVCNVETVLHDVRTALDAIKY